MLTALAAVAGVGGSCAEARPDWVETASEVVVAAAGQEGGLGMATGVSVVAVAKPLAEGEASQAGALQAYHQRLVAAAAAAPEAAVVVAEAAPA